MKQSNLTAGDFVDAFRAYDRVSNFEYDGLHALYEYLTDLEDGTGDEMELDVVALCCDFTRYESLEDYCEQYGVEPDDAPEQPEDLDAFACMVGDGPAFITYAH